MEGQSLMRKRKQKEWLVVSLLMAVVGVSLAVEFEVAAPTLSLENGKKLMQELREKSKMPTEDGSCWKSALENLQHGCKMMTEEVQARMALRFTSCFNEMMGQSALICKHPTPTKECLQKLDPLAVSTFREYFLHTQDMCYYLRQEIWQEHTNIAVNRLTDAATDVTNQMYEQKIVQEQIFHSQQESLQVQSNMKKDNEELYNAVVKVKDVFYVFSKTARENQLISSEIFDKLSRMQKLMSWIQGEMNTFDMIFFYFAAFLFGCFVTSTTRTKGARFWLVILFMLEVWGEKAVFQYLTVPERNHHILPEDVQYYVWGVRKFAAGIGTMIVIIAAATYRDIQTVNHIMLQNMNVKLDKVVQYINDQAKNQGANGPVEMQALDNAARDEAADDADESDDSFSNYSSDDDHDILSFELEDLAEEDRENLEPRGFERIRKTFKRSTSQSKMVLSPMQHHGYNLRQRSATPHENAIIHEESVTSFARLIKKKTLRPARRDSGPEHDMESPLNESRSRTNYFSSDDDDQ